MCSSLIYQRGKIFIYAPHLFRFYFVVITWNNQLLLFLACRALVEIKPILFVAEDIEEPTENAKDQSCSSNPGYWGFQHADWHDSCFQSCIVPGKLCTVVLSVSSELASMICLEDKNKEDYQNSFAERQMDRVSRFCIYLLDKIMTENAFSWQDTMVCFLSNDSSFFCYCVFVRIILTLSFLT